MNERPRTRVWVVTRVDDGSVTQADVFDDNMDAQNFAGEMSVDTDNLTGRFQVLDSYLHCKHPVANPGIDTKKFTEQRVDALYDDLGFDSLRADTKAAGQYIIDHKAELVEESNRLIRDYILGVLKKKGLLTK
ncbi:MAG: hypothetical protein RR340_01125 [Cloacibacillus sp.]